MRLTVKRDEFRKAFAITASLLRPSARTQIPGVFLSPRDGHALLFSTDGQITIQTAVTASCEFGRDAMLPKQVGRAISSIKSDCITLDFNEGTVKLEGESWKFVFREPDLQQDTKPPEAVMDDVHVEMSPRLFRRAVRSTSFATFSLVRTHNLGLQSVNIKVSGPTITFTATDGTKIARFVADLTVGDSEQNSRSVLLAPDVLRQLNRLAFGSTVKICIKDDRLAVFGFGDKTVVTVRLISGSFPKMDDVFATFDREADSYETVEVTNGDLAAMLAQTAIVSTGDHQVVRLFVSKKHLWSEMCTPEIGEASCYINVASEANRKQVKLDVQLLREGIAALRPRERVSLSISDMDLPIKLSTDNFTYIVMPLAADARQQHAYNNGIGTSRKFRREIPGLTATS